MDCTHHDQLGGLRDEDLRPEERRALVAHRKACPRCARIAEEDRVLIAALSRIPDPKPLFLLDIPRNSWKRTLLGKAPLLPWVPLVLLLMIPPMVVAGRRWMNPAPPPAADVLNELEIALSAVSEETARGKGQARPIAGGVEMPLGQSLHLTFRIAGAGYLSLWEQREEEEVLSLLWPSLQEPWLVTPGTHFMGEPGPSLPLASPSSAGFRIYIAFLTRRPPTAAMAPLLSHPPQVKGERASAQIRVLWVDPTQRASEVSPREFVPDSLPHDTQ